MFPSIRTAPLGSRQIPGSPYSLTILQEGFNRPRSDGSFEADGSVTLVRGGPVTALVDTGGPWGRRRLLDELEAIGVSPLDVTHVLCTHGHSDHVGNLNLFPSATLLVGFDLSCGDGVFLPNGLDRGVPYAPHPGSPGPPSPSVSAMFPSIRTAPLGSRQIPGSPYSLTILQEGFNRPRSDGSFEADGSVTL
ncbi:metallo-beta-lactamase domain-containing protein 1, partial [Lagopus leucura]|uniref:metallo-beta-lactamase domain-containing protein 1 n=1 Tax=Lagopus leucura TaxID=30410 RepID=UPI001C679F09